MLGYVLEGVGGIVIAMLLAYGIVTFYRYINRNK